MSDLPDVVSFTNEVIANVGHAPHAAGGSTADPGMAIQARATEASAGKLGVKVGSDGYLKGSNILVIPTKRVQRLWPWQLGEEGLAGNGEMWKLPHIRGITWHWTDTAPGTGPVLAHNAIEIPKQGEHEGSWHLAIDDGKMYQSAPASVGTWHAGGASAGRFEWDRQAKGWKEQPHTRGDLPSANSLFFGIELVNVGEVRFVNGRGWLGWPFGNAAQEKAGNKSVHVLDENVVECEDWHGTKKHYMKFTDSQVAQARAVVSALRDAYDLPAEACAYTHHDIDPDRREDPGPLWAHHILPGILADIYGED